MKHFFSRSLIRAVFPPLQWLPAYEARWLTADIVAGITLAAYAIPVSLAYASLAGVPPEVGIYGYLLGGLGYALFGSSRQLAIGPTSSVSLMIGATVATMAAGDPARYLHIVSLAGFTAAAMFFLAWIFNLSALTSFISETILVGFKAGVGLAIAVSQLPGLLGIPGSGGHFITQVQTLVLHLGDASPTVMAVGFSALALLICGEKFLPGRPVALFVVIFSVLVTAAIGANRLGVPMVGQIPAGLPSFGLPEFSLSDIDSVIPLAAGCLMLSYIESTAAARIFAAKHGDAIDARQELLGLGGANLAVAFGHGYTVGGGLSQTAVNDQAGAKTPLALVFATATLVVCLLYLTGLLRDLPKAVLAAIVLMSVWRLINVPEMLRMRRISKLEFRIAVVALIGALLLGVLKGVMLAAAASLLVLLARGSRPHVAFLGRIPGTSRFSDLERHPDNEKIPGMVVFRVESSLLYFNVDHVLNEVLRQIQEEGDGVRMVVCDLSSSPSVDLAGARMLHKLHDELQKRGIALRLAETLATVRDMLRAEGLAAVVGSVNRHTSIDEIITGAIPTTA